MTLCVCVILRVGPHPYHFLLRSTVWIVRFLHNVFVPAADWLRNSPKEKQISLCPNRYGHWLLIPLPSDSSDFLLGLQHRCLPGSCLFTVPESRCWDLWFLISPFRRDILALMGHMEVAFCKGKHGRGTSQVLDGYTLPSSFNFDVWIWLDLSSEVGAAAGEPRPVPHSLNSPGAVPLFLPPQLS